MRISAGEIKTVKTIHLEPYTSIMFNANFTAANVDGSGIVSCNVYIDTSNAGVIARATLPDSLTESSVNVAATHSAGETPEKVYINFRSGSTVDVTMNQFFTF